MKYFKTIIVFLKTKLRIRSIIIIIHMTQVIIEAYSSVLS